MSKEQNEKKKNILICIIYCFALSYMILKSSFYYNEVDFGPDMKAHLSYVTYEHDNPLDFVGKLDKMYLYDYSVIGNKAYIIGEIQEINYLRHPYLYYKLMALMPCWGSDSDGEYINLDVLYAANVLLTSLGLIVCMLWGQQKIQKMGNQLLLHALYASIIVTVPMISYMSGSVTNDNMLYLFAGLYLYGIDGVIKRRKYTDYLLLAIGISGAFMTKYTLGVMVFAGACVTAAYCILKDNGIKIFANKKFAASSAIYLIPIAYLIRMKIVFGSFFPSTSRLSSIVVSNEFSESLVDHEMNFKEAVKFLLEGFGHTWSLVYTHSIMNWRMNAADYFYCVIWIVSLGAFVVALVKSIYKKKVKDEHTFIFSLVGIGTALVYQWKGCIGGYMAGGYSGGYQARYYLCMIAPLALSNVFLFKHFFDNKKILKIICYGLCLVYVGMLWYFDFYYFLITFTLYRNIL